MSAEQTPDLAAVRELVRVLLAELPTDITGHITDCGYDDNERCGCYSLPQRLWEALAPVLAAAARVAKVEAWDEGYALDWTGGVKWDNPYRADRVAVDAPEGGEGR